MTTGGPRSKGEPLSCPPSSWIQGSTAAQGEEKAELGVTRDREESRAEVGVHVGQEVIEDAPVTSPVGHPWPGTHLQGILFLPAAPVEEQEEEEGGREQNREGAFQGASHGPCWLSLGRGDTSGHSLGKATTSWVGTWTHPRTAPHPRHSEVHTGSSHGPSGDTCACPLWAGTGTSQPWDTPSSTLELKAEEMQVTEPQEKLSHCGDTPGPVTNSLRHVTKLWETLRSQKGPGCSL